MQTIESIEQMQQTASALKVEGKKIGYVPTMGALHEGHLSLIDIAKKQCDVLVVSIFVNPTQFGPNEDLDKYPRQLQDDLDKCRDRGVDIAFCPRKKDIYPADYSTFVNEEKLSTGLCGVSRPQFFRGVCTIVAKLFNIVQPALAVFGQKDAQQVAVIKRMVRDLCFPIDIVVGPTVREPDGLAMSSRNEYLSNHQRSAALAISESLEAGKKMVDRGFRNTDRVRAEIIHHLSQRRNIRVIYVDIVDKDSMEPLREIDSGRTLIAAAVWVDEIRLIDNILI